MVTIEGERLAEFDRLADELKLPTNSQIALDSRNEFLGRLQFLPPKIGKYFGTVNPKEFYRGVYGFDAIRTLSSKPSLVKEMTKAFNIPGANLIILPINNDSRCATLVNLRAAQRIMWLHSDYFPQNLHEPEEWLSRNIHKLTDTEAGLLSGFPLTSVLEYPLWENFWMTCLRGGLNYNPRHLVTACRGLNEGIVSLSTLVSNLKGSLGNIYSEEDIKALIRAGKIEARGREFPAILFTEEDVYYGDVSSEFLEYLMSHPDFSLEKVIEPVCLPANQR
jgi:hypothetical protein